MHVHVTLADGAPLKNLREAVHNAHLRVDGLVAAPMACAQACLTEEERELGVALVEIGADVTNNSYGGQAYSTADITDAIASHFGIRRSQAERLKCVAGSAISTPSDHSEMIPVHGPNDDFEESKSTPLAWGADEKNRIARAKLISIINQQLSQLAREISQALKDVGFTGPGAGQVVLTGGGAELAGLAEFMQGALGLTVRLGNTPALRGLPEAHATPGFSTLTGLCLYAADEPADLKSVRPLRQDVLSPGASLNPLAAILRLWWASREYF